MTKRTTDDKARKFWDEAQVRADARKGWPDWQRAGVTVTSAPPSRPANPVLAPVKPKATGKR